MYCGPLYVMDRAVLLRGEAPALQQPAALIAPARHLTEPLCLTWRPTAAAWQVADELLAAHPSDEHVLSTLGLILKGAGRSADLGAAYERAAAADPKNRDLAHGAFGACVRDFAFVRQQAVALRCAKQFGGDAYQWWVVDSLVLQAREASAAEAAAAAAAGDGGSGVGGALGGSKLLQLAESMAGRLAARGKELQGREAAMLYLGILQAQVGL